MKPQHILISSLGNCLEWFDFGLFLFLAPLIGTKFFHAQNPNSATLAALGVFATGFIARPLGGIFFGHLGDRTGRRNTLRYSILTMTAVTFIIGCLPTYASVGIWASIVFVALRIIQGLSVGGEYGGIMIYLAESAPFDRRGFITSFAATGANIGFLLASLLILLMQSCLPEEIIQSWGWRLPFIIMGFAGILVFYLRFNLLETPVYLYLKEKQHIQQRPLLTALRCAWPSLLKIFVLSGMSSTFYYIFFGYMPSYLTNNLGISARIAFLLQSASLIFMLFLVPIAGICGDRFGRKKMLLCTAFSIILLTLPCFYLLRFQTIGLIALALFIATLISSLDQGNSLTAVVENCPENVRYSGVSFSYNLGMAIFGGTAPLMVNLLAHHFNTVAPAYYLIAVAGISVIAIFTLIGQRPSRIIGNFQF